MNRIAVAIQMALAAALAGVATQSILGAVLAAGLVVYIVRFRTFASDWQGEETWANLLFLAALAGTWTVALLWHAPLAVMGFYAFGAAWGAAWGGLMCVWVVQRVFFQR